MSATTHTRALAERPILKLTDFRCQHFHIVHTAFLLMLCCSTSTMLITDQTHVDTEANPWKKKSGKQLLPWESCDALKARNSREDHENGTWWKPRWSAQHFEISSWTRKWPTAFTNDAGNQTEAHVHVRTNVHQKDQVQNKNVMMRPHSARMTPSRDPFVTLQKTNKEAGNVGCG